MEPAQERHLRDVSEQELVELLTASSGTVLVDIWSEACALCKAMAPMLAQLDGDLAEVEMVAVKLDDHLELAGAST